MMFIAVIAFLAGLFIGIAAGMILAASDAVKKIKGFHEQI